MNCWAEFRTTMVVARLGSASAAASALGLHRATVTRHIEVVEASLGATLFLRHARGVQLTDTGREMLEVAGRVEDMLTDLQGRTRHKTSQLSGELVITSLDGLALLIMPAIHAYEVAHPAISVSFLSEIRLAQLEYGEAHIAVRAGKRPAIADYVVRPFRRVRFGFYGHREYIDETRKRARKTELSGYKYIGSTENSLNLPFAKWLNAKVPNPSIALKVNDQGAVLPAVLARLGVGVLAEHIAQHYSELEAVVPPSKATSVPLWIVTHRDLKNVVKVQEFIRIMKETDVASN